MGFVRGVALAALLAGCGGKKAPEPAADGGSAEAAVTAEMPDTAEAKAFAKSLVKTEVKGLGVVSSGGGRLDYNTLTFAPDGRWNATGVVKASDEQFECKETGTWSIEGAETAESATMEWTVEKTTCATREAGTKQRVQMTILKGGEYKIAFR